MEQFKGICKILLTSAIAMALMHSARAQSSSASNPGKIVTSREEVSRPSINKKFGITAILTNETNLEESSSASDSSATTLELVPSYRISSKAKVSALIGAERSEDGLKETKLLNTVFYLNRDAIPLNEDTDLFLTAQILLPTDEKARQKASLEGGIGAIMSVSHRFLSFKRTSNLMYSLNTFKYAHDFDRNTSREANISYRFRNIVTYGVDISKKVSLSLSGYFQSGFTYDNVAKEVFYLEQGISYAFDQKFSVALTHNTSGNAFEKNGKDWNIEAYDSRNSTLAASLTYIY